MWRISSCFIFLFLPVCFLFNSLAQQKGLNDNYSVQPLKFTHFSSKDGLPQNSVLAIHQDQLGFIWMGTDDGLARYDGYQFRVFRHEPGDSLSLNNNVIRAIISDPSGQLWIGTEGGGVSIFDPIREKFSPIYLNENFPIILKDGKVSSMLLANDQSIWISTNGIIKILI